MARRARIAFGESVVDVGCGVGASLVPASSVAGWIVGIDRAVEMLEHVPWPVPLVTGDAEALPLRSDAFDVALCGFVIQFLPRPRTGAGEALRVLRPGGRIIVGVPDAEIPACGAVKQRWASRNATGPPPPQRPATWVEEVLSDAGFDRIEGSAESQTFTFATGDDYVAWNWSHGARAIFEAVPETQRGEFLSELSAAAESSREGDSIPLHTTARFWTAVKPG